MAQFDTKLYIVDKSVDNVDIYAHLQEAARWIQEGEVVAFPTETVYGLGADATHSEAVRKIYAAKGRPSDNPLIVHIAQLDQLQDVAYAVPDKARKLMEAFWPGPITFILPAKAGLAPEVTAGLETVGVRMPDHPIARALIEAANTPIAAPSANRSGRPSPTTAQHVWEDLQGRIPLILDGGETGVGVESTVLDVTLDPPVILRPGGVSQEELQAMIGEVRLDPGLQDQSQPARAPGMKYRHYAPHAPLYLIEGEGDEAVEKMRAAIMEQVNTGKRVGVLTVDEESSLLADLPVTCLVRCGSRNHLEEVAHQLFHGLRQFDAASVDIILSRTFPRQGIGLAIMNRLHKAAGGRYYQHRNQ